MSLRDRLAGTGVVIEPRMIDTTVERENGTISHDTKDAIKRNIHYLLIEEMGTELDSASDEVSLRYRIEAKLHDLLNQETTPLSAEDKREIVVDVIDNILGYGPIEALLNDPTVTEVMVNSPRTVYIERAGRIYLTDKHFVDEAHLLRIIDKIVARVGRRVDEASPMVDARLPDGSRVNAVIAPLAINGPMLTIRKFSHDPFTAEDLISFGTMNERVSHFLDACVRGRLNILISGGTGTGKTTLLNVVSAVRPGRRAHRHRGGRRRAAPASGARAAPGVAPAEHRGQGAGHHPRPGAQHVAHAPRPHHRRRGAWRRGARHAAGDEHGS